MKLKSLLRRAQADIGLSACSEQMKRVLLLAFGMTALLGCQSSEAPTAEAAPAPVPRKLAQVGTPSSSEPTKIGLVVRKGPAITVGYPSPDKLLEQFHDPKHFGSEYDDLPSNFDAAYRARTWETAHMGFGEITYHGELVAAMYQEDKVDQDRVDELVDAHRAQVDLLPTMLHGKKVSYWFWEVPNQRLMICAYQSGHEGIKLTVAMGDNNVMDALGISPTFANKDLARIDAGSIQPAGPITHASKP
jgi:hypothetical protein